MKVIIPLAGKGTRMRPHTHTTAKPLLHVAGRPMISYILDEVERLNPTSYYFATGHLKDQVEQFFKDNYSFDAKFIEQKVKDGTAGAIRLFEDMVDEPVLIIFADTIFDCDMSILNDLKEDGAIWVKEVEDYQRFGVVVTDENGIITDMVEKPSEPVSKLANIGMYYIKNSKLMFECIKELYERGMKTKGEYCLPDAFKLMIKRGEKFKALEVDGWYDCGKPETMLETSRIMLQKREEFLSQEKYADAKVENSIIISPVAIEKGAHVKDSVIGPYVSIAKNSTVERCVLKDCIVGKEAVLKNIVAEESLIGEGARTESIPKKLNIGDHSELITK